MPVPMQADVVVPVRADVVGGKVEMRRFCTHFATLSFMQVLCRCDRADVVGGKVGRCDRRRSWDELPLSSYQALSFVQVLSRDDVNHFYISIKLVVVIR